MTLLLFKSIEQQKKAYINICLKSKKENFYSENKINNSNFCNNLLNGLQIKCNQLK